MFNGFWLDEASGLSVGSWSKAEIRRTVCITALFLLASSIKEAVKDTRHRWMYFVKKARLKPDVVHPRPSCPGAGLKQERQGPKIHAAVWTLWFASVAAWVIVLGSRQPDADAPWVSTLLWVLAVLMLASMCTLCGLFTVRVRLCHLFTSLVAWQGVLLMTTNFVVTLGWPDPVHSAQDLPASIVLFISFIFPMVLDGVQHSKIESAGSILLCIVSCICSLIGNLYLWSDDVVFQGWRQGNTTQFWIGQWSKAEIRRGCANTLLFLLLIALKDCYFDTPNARMYFCRDCVIKPGNRHLLPC